MAVLSFSFSASITVDEVVDDIALMMGAGGRSSAKDRVMSNDWRLSDFCI